MDLSFHRILLSYVFSNERRSMKYKEFLQTIETEIKKKLEDGYSLKIHPVKKNNGKIYDGLLII